MFDPIIPRQWSAALNATLPGVTNLVDTGTSDWIGALERVIPAVVAGDAQRRILAVQLERARAGQAPLDTAAYGVGVNIGLDPTTRNVLIGLGVGALALWALSRRSR